jgi:hypothetical protein
LILAEFGYAAALVLGIPAHLVLHRKAIVSLRGYAIVGTLIGLLTPGIVFGIDAIASFRSMPEHAVAMLGLSTKLSLVAIPYAAVASIAFWAIAVATRAQIIPSAFR